MPWPTPQDYNEAIQNPAHCFSDPDLRSGQPDLTPLGLPRPITGNFASVYRLRCGRRDWAVRCFWRQYADMAQRYEAISHYLEDLKLPYTVGFQYLAQGIRVRGQWYPVLKMEWVEGRLLDDYVAAHLGDRTALAALARQWREMVAVLESHAVAHGDLQHGNVLVRNGNLTLVDYDAMFVPALNGRTSHELGHQNYQHPRRTGTDFGVYVDHFSAWVIYLSLTALSVDPGLWAELKGGDERLLLHRGDFQRAPQGSGLVRLAHHADPSVRSLATQISSFLDLAPDRVPALGPPPGAPQQNGFARERLASRLRRGKHAVPSSLEEASVMPAWIADWAQHERPEFAVSPALAWACMGASAAGVAGTSATLLALMPATAAVALPIIASGIVAGVPVLAVSYRLERSVRERSAIAARGREHRKALQAGSRACDRLSTQRTDHERQRDTCLEAVSAARSGIERIRAADLEAAAALHKTRMDRVRAGLHEVEEQERAEIARRLARRRDLWVDQRLRKSALRSASLPGVSWWVRGKLWLRGVRCAADVSPEHAEALKRLRPADAAAVLAWRKGVQREAHSTAPRSLPDRMQTRIVARHEGRRKRLGRRQARITASNDALRIAVNRYHDRRLERLDRHMGARIAAWNETHDRLDRSIAALRADEPMNHWHLDQIQQELKRYRGVTFPAYVRQVVRTWLARGGESAGNQGKA